LHPTTPRHGVRRTAQFDDLLNDEKLDAVAIAAPVAARFELASAAIAADKHIYVHGVPAQTAPEAELLIAQARRRGRVLVTGDCLHRFDPGVERLRGLLAAGDLGDVLYLDCDRHVCGRSPEQDELLWSAGAEEVALALHLLADQPVTVDAHGESYLDVAAPDVLHWRLLFATGIVAEMQVSGLDARPGSRIAFVGSKATAVLERGPDVLTVYTKVGGDRRSEGTTFSVGDVVSPRVAGDDPVRRSWEAFLGAIRSTAPQPEPRREVVAVVETLERIQRALRRSASIELRRTRPASELRVVGVSGSAS
jgi:predicted dehydrogenase